MLAHVLDVNRLRIRVRSHSANARRRCNTHLPVNSYGLVRGDGAIVKGQGLPEYIPQTLPHDVWRTATATWHLTSR